MKLIKYANEIQSWTYFRAPMWPIQFKRFFYLKATFERKRERKKNVHLANEKRATPASRPLV